MYHRRLFAEHRPEYLTGTLRQLSEAVAHTIVPTVCLIPGPPDAVTVRFLPTTGIEVEVPETYPTEERRQFFTNRWMATWALLTHTKLRHPDLVGSARLWLDDWPNGPGLAFCGNAVSHVLIPDQVFLETAGYAQARADVARTWRPWLSRSEQVFWRGASTGLRHLLHAASWRDLPRFKLCLAARAAERPDLFDIGINAIVQIWDDAERREIDEAGVLRDEAPLLRFMEYRHSVDVDGNTCSWPGLFTKLLMGITVLKVDSQLGFRQWYYDRLVPWRNFVPLAVDLTELVATAEWLGRHSHEAEAIARAGRELADSLSYSAVLDDAANTIARFVGRT